MKTFVNNSHLLEFLCETTDRLVAEKFGFNRHVASDDGTGTTYSEEAQDYFNEQYENIEADFNKILNIHSDTELEFAIDEIKKMLDSVGYVSVADLELPASPVFNNIGGMFQLVEGFTVDSCRVVTYIAGYEKDAEEVPYTDLTPTLLLEIHEAIKDNLVIEK